MSFNGLMDNQTWYSHTVEYYLAINKNVVLIYLITWMNLKCILLSTRSQAQKQTNCASVCMTFSKRQNVVIEKISVFCQRLRIREVVASKDSHKRDYLG